MTNAKILIVQENEPDAVDLEERLQGLGHTVCATVPSGRRAIEKAAEMRPDLALIDLGLEGDVDGIEAAEQIGRRFNIAVIYLTDDARENLLQRAQTTRPFGYVLKPFEERQLHLNIQTALSMQERERKHRETELRLERTVTELQDQTQLMETVFNSMSEGIVVADATGRLLLANPGTERIFSTECTEAADSEPGEWAETHGVFYPDQETYVPMDQLPLVRALQGESTDGLEVFVRNEKKPDGVYLSISGQPVLSRETNEVKAGVVVFRDITKSKKIEARLEQTVSELRNQTRLMETVFNSVSDGVVVTGADGSFLLINPRAEQIVGAMPPGRSPDQWAETYGMFHPDKVTPFPIDDLPLMLALRGEASDDVELFIRNPGKSKGVYISVNARPLHDTSGTAEGGVIVFRDITKLKETEAELRQTVRNLQDQAQLMETVFNSMSEGIIVADATGRLLFANPSAERISGMEMVPSKPSEWAQIYGIFYLDQETHVPTDQNPLVRALRGESTDDFEAFVRNEKKPDGVYVSGNGRPILSHETNEVTAGVVVFRDITKSKKIEARLERTIAELQDQSRLMETTFNSVSDGVVVTDTDGRFLLVNPSAERIVGMGATGAPSDQWSETYGTFYPDGETLFPSKDLPLMRAMCGEASDDTELLIRNPERPEGVYISVNARPLRDDAGVVKGGVIIFRDITKLKEIEAELRQTVRNLQDQAQLMETVFNSISDGVVATDENGSYLIFNTSAKRITGMYEPAAKLAQRPETYGLFLLDRETPFPADELPIARAIRGEATDGVEMFIRNPKRPEGVYTSVSGRPLRDDAGITKGGVIVFRDVTAIKEAEERLQQTAASLRTQTHAMETIFNSISDGVVVADENGDFRVFNPSAERIVGIGRTDTGPDQWTDRYGIFFLDRATPFPTGELPLVRAIRGESSNEVEMFIRNPRIPEGVCISVSGEAAAG